jgi:Protein of unknown function (DUF3145)
LWRGSLGKAHLALQEDSVTARGVVFIHSAPTAVCPHVEWAIAGIVGSRVSLRWAPQPAAPGLQRAEMTWRGEPATASRIASVLHGWRLLRFEVTEEPSPGCDGVRFSCTPSLGIFAAVIGVHGDLLVPENRLRAALVMASGGRAELAEEVDRLLGKPWDDELEPFRQAGAGAPVRWLHQVG